ncbi:MAG: AbrB/MazE/SpoVT family DNA-binding domain-containing protein [Phycisphaerae bacterium]|nr:AbrB/MazE/SpoVT family DNA-binding domain-containing protein [Phycisphaerae bacterium]
MGDTSGIAKIFMHGCSQAVRLPRAFRMDGEEVRVRRDGRRLILEPIISNVDEWFKSLDTYAEPFIKEGRDPPPMPADREMFDD